jgi:hypothetical protein
MSLKLNDLSKLNKKDLRKSLKLQDIDTLKKIKQYLDDKYYNTGEKTEFTDEQYDLLKDMNNITKKYFKLKSQQPMYNKDVHVTKHKETAEKIMIFVKS